MTDYIRKNFIVDYLNSDENRAERLVDSLETFTSSYYTKGTATFISDLDEELFLEDMDIVVLITNYPVKLDIEYPDTSYPVSELSGVTNFCYKGSPINIKITYDDEADLVVKYFASKEQ